MFLHDPARIEGLRTCHFIALMIQALIERRIRRAIAAANLAELPIYPEGRGCSARSAPRIFQIFAGLAHRHLIGAGGAVIQTFSPELTKLQQIVLELLGVPDLSYRWMGDARRSPHVWKVSHPVRMDDLSYSESIVAEGSPAKVYDMASDVTSMGEWSPICKACWWENGDGPHVGAWFVGRNELPERV